MPKAGDSRTRLVMTMARLLRDQGYAATGLSQVLAESGVSNGSLYHHFPGGMEDLAEAALDASGRAVTKELARALDGAPDAAEGLCRYLDMAAGQLTKDGRGGCPIAPTALEVSHLSPRLRAAAAHCYVIWEEHIAERLRADGWPEESAVEAASAALSLIEGALLLARVSGQLSHLANAKAAVLVLLAPRGQRSNTRRDRL